MEDIKFQVGQSIREARKKKGLTQKEFGKKMGVSESAVNKYESGKENPSAQTLQKVAEALGMILEINFREV